MLLGRKLAGYVAGRQKEVYLIIEEGSINIYGSQHFVRVTGMRKL